MSQLWWSLFENKTTYVPSSAPTKSRIAFGWLFYALAGLLFCTLGAQPCRAQRDTGTILGVVKDTSGALVPSAKVIVKDVDRGTSLVTATDTAGEYVASPLHIGRYTVTVEKPGFKRAIAGPWTLNVQARLAINITLEVGAVSQTVTVTSSEPQLETATSSLGDVIGSHMLTTLPLNGRNFAQLALLEAGVAPAEPGSRLETSYGFSSNGGRTYQNNFMLDGVDNNSNLGDILNGTAYVIQTPVDAIAEFKVQTNAFSAEFGRGNGAVVNVLLRSGTNHFHGDLYEFLRNEKLDAQNSFDIFGRQPYKQNQFGFTLGGPIVKNKTFFFVDYEGLRVRQSLPLLETIPDQAQLSGDFSEFLTNTPAMAVDANGNPTNQVALDCSGNPTYVGEIFNTRLTQASNLNPSGFCGVPIATDSTGAPTNIFPSNLIDPLASRLAALYPHPNTTIGGGNFLTEPEKQESQNNFDIRVDQNFSSSDTFFARFSYEDQPSYIPPPFNNALDGGSFADGYQDDSYRSVAISETHLFRPTLVNEFRLGYNRINSHRFNLNYNENVSAQLGFPGVPYSPGIGGLPELDFSDGTVSIGSSGYLPSIEKQNTYLVSDTVTWTHGRHSWKFGTTVHREQFTIYQPAQARGDMTFGSDFTDNPAAPGTGGQAIATFLLGIPDSGYITNLHNVDYHRYVAALFAQDDFTVTPRLTLNLGLRYELYTTIKALDNQQANFNIATNTLILPTGQTAQLTPSIASQVPVARTASSGLIPPRLNNFAPRFGLAFQITPKLVLRSGYGIFFGGDEAGPWSNPSPGFNPPFFVSDVFSTPCTASAANPSVLDCSIPGLNVLSQGFPASALVDPNTPLLFSVDPNLKTPYTEQWHLGLQYQLPSQTMLEVDYAGSRGEHLYGFYNGNQAVPTADPTAPTAPRRPDPNIDTGIDALRTNAISWYNSLQVRLDKRVTHGLLFQFSYTYSHSLDDASSASLGSNNNGDFRNQLAPIQEYGNSDFDVRHRLVVSYTYQLPFGRGMAFGKDASGFLNQVIGGWQFNGVTTASTGNYYTVTDSITNPSNSDCGGTVGFYCSRPNLVGNPNAKPCLPGTLFNTCAFTTNTVLGTFGNAGRNIVLGPGFQNWDFSLFKNFPVTESKRFEFRAEFFNIFNHVNPIFYNLGEISAEPVAVELGTPTFGYPISARAPREIQVALKFYF
jgi:Carboxypeptidase regulatory-like domain/TonB dependent receptor-like, beta-barrel